MNILVADDDPTFRLIAEAVLRNLGHEYRSVSDGTQAWEAVRSERPDVVISDWLMPGLTGPQLCRNIRASAPGEYTYFIMLTGHGSSDEILEGMSAGADDYLVKPLRPDDLHARLIAADRVTSLHRRLADRRVQMEGHNDALATLARRDPLTGLRNRLALDEDLEVLEARVVRYGHRYSIALLDIDRFKTYNDTYGHPAGDRILRAVADELSAQVRGGDAVYRYGGEEFLGLFPEQSLATGTIALERMRLGVEQLALPHEGKLRGVVTVSAGIAVMDPDHPRPASEVLQEADEALYRAKRLGRNQVRQNPQKGGRTVTETVAVFEPAAPSSTE